MLRRKSVKRQHPWQKATSSRLLCSAVSCGILAQVLLAFPQFVIVGSCRRPCAQTQPSGEIHLRQHHDGGGDRGEGRTSVGVSDVKRTASEFRISCTLPSACTLAIRNSFPMWAQFLCRSMGHLSRESAYRPLLEKN